MQSLSAQTGVALARSFAHAIEGLRLRVSKSPESEWVFPMSALEGSSEGEKHAGSELDPRCLPHSVFLDLRWRLTTIRR
jgi:hypothetical protein